MVCSLTWRLFELTEELAAKEMERDIKGFIKRDNLIQTRQRSEKYKGTENKHTTSYPSGNQLIIESREKSSLLFEEIKTYEPPEVQLIIDNCI